MATGVFPAIPLTPLAGGLLSAARVVRHDSGTPDWSRGSYSWDTIACPNSLLVTDLCDGAKSGPITEGTYSPPIGWPLGIVLNYTCSTLGLTLEERRRTVRDQIEAGTQKAIERELQTGEAAISGGRYNTHYLTDPDSVSVGGSGAVDIRLGVAALEQAMADCGLGLEGTIHMPRAAASLLAQHGALRVVGDRFFTALGTPIAAGAGYTVAASLSQPRSTAPTAPSIPTKVLPGPLPGDCWIYATGPVAVHLGAVDVLEELKDHAQNTITTTAVRAAAAYFDTCCHFAVQVKLT
jgi:hypothetical protein